MTPEPESVAGYKTDIGSNLLIMVLFVGVMVYLYASQPKLEEYHRYQVEVQKVVDGDTIDVLPMKWKRVRLSNGDAWETRRVRRTPPVTDPELIKGKQAKKAVEDLLATYGEVWIVETGERDSFGRILGRILVNTGEEVIDLGLWLKENGHQRTFD